VISGYHLLRLAHLTCIIIAHTSLQFYINTQLYMNTQFGISTQCMAVVVTRRCTNAYSAFAS